MCIKKSKTAKDIHFIREKKEIKYIQNYLIN
jgi:hypothetical protein